MSSTNDFVIENGVLTKYIGEGGDVVIPNSVTSIENRAFEGCTSLKSITMPDSVTSIEDCAFFGCTSLKSITIPDSVTSIGWNAFSRCASLKSITIPDSVTEIGWFAFEGCTALTSIIIPDSVTSFGKGAFEGCTALTSVTIPEGVTDIGECAFAGCTSLICITIPDSVTGIAWNAFLDTAYYNDASNWVNNVLYIGNHLIKAKKTLSDEYAIKAGTKTIAVSAFQNCTSLTSIIIPDSVTSIGWCAFLGTAYYNDASNWENNVLYIGNHLIKAKKTLSDEYAIIAGTKVIADYAFDDRTALKSIIIPNSVTSIGWCAFYSCIGLTSITIPDSVTDIKESAFLSCDNLIIHGSAGSAAEQFAKKNNINFIAE